MEMANKLLGSSDVDMTPNIIHHNEMIRYIQLCKLI